VCKYKDFWLRKAAYEIGVSWNDPKFTAQFDTPVLDSHLKEIPDKLSPFDKYVRILLYHDIILPETTKFANHFYCLKYSINDVKIFNKILSKIPNEPRSEWGWLADLAASLYKSDVMLELLNKGQYSILSILTLVFMDKLKISRELAGKRKFSMVDSIMKVVTGESSHDPYASQSYSTYRLILGSKYKDNLEHFLGTCN